MFNKEKTLNKAYERLTELYGAEPDINILNRYFYEKMFLERSGYLRYLSLFGRVRKRAREIGEHIEIRGTNDSSFISYKRTTTYTMLKRLCERGLFANEDGVVVVCMKREDFQAARGEKFIEENFEGSLPLFLAAFTRRKKLGEKEVQMLKEMIDNYEED